MLKYFNFIGIVKKKEDTKLKQIKKIHKNTSLEDLRSLDFNNMKSISFLLDNNEWYSIDRTQYDYEDIEIIDNRLYANDAESRFICRFDNTLNEYIFTYMGVETHIIKCFFNFKYYNF